MNGFPIYLETVGSRGNDDITVFDVEPTKVMEFSMLFSGRVGEERDYDQERQLLRDGRDLYECGRLRYWNEFPNDTHRIVAVDVMGATDERAHTHVTICMKNDDEETVTGMSCTCTRNGAPQCVHACAVCFRLFYRHRYASRGSRANRMVMPHEASDIVERYMADRLGTWFSSDAKEMSSVAEGLEIITGFNRWTDWIGNRHTVGLLGNCMPSIEESIDMDTQIWPKRDEPDLTAVLPHGWFTMLEAAYERLGDSAKLAKMYAVYIAQGRLPQDACYVDRLRWLLGNTTKLTQILGELTGSFQLPQDNRMKPVASLSYEHLLREFGLSDEAVSYCESLKKYDRRCTRRLAEVISIGNTNRVKELETPNIDWRTRFGDDDIEIIVKSFQAYLKEQMPAFFVNGYVDPIVEDCEELIRSAAAGIKARCRLIISRRFTSTIRATIARDLLSDFAESDCVVVHSDSIILERSIAMVEPRADRLARTFLVDDDVVVFTVPLDEATLQTERPQDFMEALRLADVVDGMPLTHEGGRNGILDQNHATDKDLDIVRRALKKRIEHAKTEARFNDIVTSADDDYDAERDPALKGLRECLDVQINALFGARFSLESVKCDDLFDPPVTMGQRNKWLRPTAGQLGVWAANYVLNLRRHELKELDKSVYLPHYLAAKGLKSAMIGMLDHMLGVTAMLGIERAQVDVDEYRALHLLRIDQHPEDTDAHGHAAILRPDRDFTVSYLTNVLSHARPGLCLVDAYNECSVQGAVEDLHMLLQVSDGDYARQHGFDDDYIVYSKQRADDTALALMLATIENLDGIQPLIKDYDVARAVAEQAKQTYMMFWHARDENDAVPADDVDDIAGHEADITDAGNMMLMMLEQAYTRLMEIAEPGYKDW
ncbi:hypothetical protein BISA_0682 [Bifidobacterium saguini DSM 23967]|uniref:SWIM-type domain-containing protein n=2 Tax=Bifidobacterium saguini TaxID=762210 RepID=A0A087D9T5_9BIFI|nr:hypothetical protein [Bifidobacterium saguini]KFI92285.1 hypothetical protein BISA_0682 [Bifidobacterium saguini DSM 23967]QTB90990.1 hypothetical protein BSD967_00630 [Bifidobacterium saguini]